VTLIAVMVAPGSTGCTTTCLALAAATPPQYRPMVAELDSSGGDVAAWAELGEQPGWSTAVASGDRSLSGLVPHVQRLPSGVLTVVAPSRPTEATVVVREASTRFVPLLAGLSDSVVFADCGRVTSDVPHAATQAAVTIVVVRQHILSAAVTIGRIDKAATLVTRLHDQGVGVVAVVVGDRPYRPTEIAAHLGVDLLGVLPDDPTGAIAVIKPAARHALARAAGPVAAALMSLVDAPDVSVRVAS
jgi:MinD-like ATPase involved in chromosome partitioning or flagellar assembly